MEVEDEALLLHGLEDGVVDSVVLDTRRRVGSHAAGVRLDAWAVSVVLLLPYPRTHR